MILYFPAKGTAGLARSLVSGKRRVPLPPASTIPRTRMRIATMDAPIFPGQRARAQGESATFYARFSQRQLRFRKAAECPAAVSSTGGGSTAIDPGVRGPPPQPAPAPPGY